MNRHEWKENELEFLGCCPICASSERVLQYEGIPDLTTHTIGKWDYYNCVACGVLYLDPRPNLAHIGHLYETYYTHSAQEERKRESWLDRVALSLRNDYLNKKFGYQYEPALSGGHFLMHLLPPWLRFEWDHFARHLPKSKPGKNRLLDVGCGNGQFLVAARSAGWHVSGVDFDQAAVLTAQKQGVNVRLSSLAAQHFPDCSFDVVTMSAVIEHVHDPVTLITECARILKPGGLLWVSTPNYASIIHQKFKKCWHSLCPQHLIIFTPSSLKKILEASNFMVNQEQRGLHAQCHCLASQAIFEGHIDMKTIYVEPFANRKLDINYWPMEFLMYLSPLKQGDIVLSGTKT